MQQALEEAIHRFCGETVDCFAAGRTDAGVHAWGQAVHFDLARAAGADTVRDAINFHLKPAPVSVLKADVVDAGFHARFSAKARLYLYRIVNRRAPLAIERGRAWLVWTPLDAGAMHAGRAAAGRASRFHQFPRHASARADSPMKTLDVLDVTRVDDEVRVAARARSFLHHQVRNMVGTLKRWSAKENGLRMTWHGRSPPAIALLPARPLRRKGSI